jgi:hypothetical protein
VAELREIRLKTETQLIHSHTLPICEFRINGCIEYTVEWGMAEYQVALCVSLGQCGDRNG